MPPEMRQIIGSLDVEREQKPKLEDLTAEDLLFRVEHMAEVAPLVRLWVKGEKDPEKQERKKRVATQVMEDFEYLRDIATTDFDKRNANFSDLARTSRFKERAVRLFRFLESEGMSDELDRRMGEMMIDAGRESQREEDYPLLPSRYYDPDIYSEEHTIVSVGLIEQDIEAMLHEKGLMETHASDVRLVMQMLLRVTGNADDTHKKKSTAHTDACTLFFLKNSYPESWEALKRLLQSPAGKDVLLTLLGKPYTWEHVSGKDASVKREQEMFIRMANPIYMALYRTIVSFPEATNKNYLDAEKEALLELYGELPAELDMEIEPDLLELEIDQMLAEMELSDEEKRRMKPMLRVLKGFEGGKPKSLVDTVFKTEIAWKAYIEGTVTRDGALEIELEEWQWFLEKMEREFQKCLATVAQDGVIYDETSDKWKRREMVEKTIFSMFSFVENMLEYAEEKFGKRVQLKITDSGYKDSIFYRFLPRDTAGRLGRRRNKDAYDKAEGLQEKKEKTLHIVHTFLTFLNKKRKHKQGEEEQHPIARVNLECHTNASRKEMPVLHLFLEDRKDTQGESYVPLPGNRKLQEIHRCWTSVLNEQYIYQIIQTYQGGTIQAWQTSTSDNKHKTKSNAWLWDMRGWDMRDFNLKEGTGVFQVMDFSGADFRGSNWKNVTISHWDFSHVIMDDAVLDHARFIHCQMEGASLQQVYAEYEFRFESCVMKRVKFVARERTDKTGFSSPHNMRVIDCDLDQASIEGDMTGFSLLGGSARGIDITGNIRSCTFEGNEEKQLNMQGARLHGLVSKCIEWRHLDLRDGHINSCHISFPQEQIAGDPFVIEACDLRGIVVTNSRFQSLHIVNTDFQGAEFFDSQRFIQQAAPQLPEIERGKIGANTWEGVEWRNCNLGDVDMRYNTILNCEFAYPTASIVDMKLDGASVRGAHFLIEIKTLRAMAKTDQLHTIENGNVVIWGYGRKGIPFEVISEVDEIKRTYPHINFSFHTPPHLI